MPESGKSPFIFISCQVGAEPALKSEIARVYPEFHFAFSRPGFVTFKRSGPKPDSSINLVEPSFDLKSVFARAYGVSLGKAERAQTLIDTALQLKSETGERLVLHVWERDQHAPGEQPKGYEKGKWAAKIQQALAAEADKDLFAKGPPELGQWVFDVIAIEEDEWWYGVHRHSVFHSSDPGGEPALELPNDAPSRAYLKLEEAIRWAKIPFQTGDTAVEIGSAPGGVSYGLLKRGLRVVGIDPGEMDPVVLRFGREKYQHIAKVIAQVPREELPEQVDWLLMDMNVAPSVSLFAVDRLVTRMKPTLLGVLLTVKLNQWKLADEIPSWIEHVKAMGMTRVKATQLASNGREITIFGLTRKGATRPAARVLP